MKKRIMSLLLVLLLFSGLAVPAMAAEEPIAYTIDKLLWVGPVPIAGITVINGEYYLPLELLGARGGAQGDYCPLSFRRAEDHYEIDSRSYSGDTIRVVKPAMYTTPWLQLGQVTPVTTPVTVLDRRTTPYQTVTLPAGCAYDLGGYYPMVSLRALGEYYGYRDAEDGIHICENYSKKNPTIIWEEDLAGQAVKDLCTYDAKANLKVFHDYLINNLTHSDFMDDAYFQQNDPQRYERVAQMYETYQCTNNAALASRYGVCQDYANLFQAMCLQNGIPCLTVSSAEMNHAWNRVWLGGAWYFVDVTFDDPGPKPTLRDTYFLVTSEKMARSHCWVGPDFAMPETYDSSWEQIDPMNLTTAEEYRKCLVAQLVQGKTSFSLHPSGADAYGGSGVIYWAMSHAPISAWSLGWTYSYNSSRGTYDYKVNYN